MRKGLWVRLQAKLRLLSEPHLSICETKICAFFDENAMIDVKSEETYQDSLTITDVDGESLLVKIDQISKQMSASEEAEWGSQPPYLRLWHDILCQNHSIAVVILQMWGAFASSLLAIYFC